jgi:hypothetical protein
VELAALALDDSWLDCLDAVARDHGLALPPAKLAAEVRALSEAYNTGNFRRARTKGALAARLLFSFPRDVPKMGAAVRELVANGKLDGPLRVLDIGAGLGASTFGLERGGVALGGTPTWVDEDESALAIGRAIAKRRALPLRTLTTRPRERFDVVLVGQSLGEMADDDDKQVAMLGELVDEALAPHGSLVIVEPALRERTRRLHRVRDRLLARPNPPTVFAPCLHASPCPALADPKAWCHEDLPIDLPPRVATLARAAGLRWQGLTFSYLVLRKDGVTLSDTAKRALRVVSSPIVTKGKRELFLCADGVRRKAMRLDRDGGKGDAWLTAQRGDLLVLEPELPADATRVPQGTRIVRV